MKRLLIVLLTLIMFALPAFAGDLPESFLYYDTAELFVGKVVGCTTTEHQSMPSDQFEIIYLDVVPDVVFKGDIEVGVSKRYTNCDLIHIVPEKDKEYLFGYLDENNFYIWEIDSFDGEKIALKSLHSMDQRLEEYINDGTVSEAEIKRRNIGKQMPFSDYLDSDFDSVESVSITYGDKTYIVDTEKFFKLAGDILVTDVKDEMMKDTYPDPNLFLSELIYIEIAHKDGEYSFAVISKNGEVDLYSPLMSRLPQKDYVMELNDLQNIYKLLPDESQKLLPALAVEEPQNNYLPYMAGGIAALLIAVVIILVIKKKK